MEDVIVTRVWMAGVIAVMALYAGIAIVGYLRNRRK